MQISKNKCGPFHFHTKLQLIAITIYEKVLKPAHLFGMLILWFLLNNNSGLYPRAPQTTYI